MENNSFNVAVLGAGNIGSAVVARLMDLDKGIVGLNVKKILVRDTKKARDISKDLLTDNFDEMLEQSRQQPLVMGIALHAYIVGQPFRLKHLRNALLHISRKREDIWFATAGQIAAHARTVNI